MPEKDESVRLGVDIGGTFTDVVLEAAGRRWIAKVLTTPRAPEDGVIAGIAETLEDAGIGPGSVDLLIHGTTLATNAILERKGAVTAFVTTRGFRDVLEIGYESRHDQYDLMIDKVPPLVPRFRRLAVSERVDVSGRVLTPLDEGEVQALASRLRELRTQSIAIGFLHSYANPAHERRARDILRRALPDIPVSLSSDVCPEVREYERFTTTSANAYVMPLMAGYLGRLSGRLTAAGLCCPFLLMTSGGNLATLETARRFPVRLVESGPAGGSVLACRVAAQAGFDKALSFDMGGTTAKICLIDGFEPQTARELEVDRTARFLKGSGLPLRIPVLEMVEIGAGGGSVARLDRMDRIAIGPDSAGADPGPAGYGRGGTRPTVTDADILLGRIECDGFADGKVKLSPDMAEDAVRADIGGPLGLDSQTAAFGIAEMVDETMSNAARVHAVERGRSLHHHALIAFGGAAPLHAARLAEKLGIDRVVIPRGAGVGSAIGFLSAPVGYEVVRSHAMRLAEFDSRAVNALIGEMRAEALSVVRTGAPHGDLSEERAAFMRYVGQGHEIRVSLPLRPFGPGDSQTLQAAYDQAYRRLFQRVIPGADVEVLTWSLSLSTIERTPSVLRSPEPVETTAPAGWRHVFDPQSARLLETPCHWRPDLLPGMTISGPAIIGEAETSTHVTGSFDARIAANGDIILERKPGATA